jgi:F-type H+-transporting ATPase subunit b
MQTLKRLMLLAALGLGLALMPARPAAAQQTISGAPNPSAAPMPSEEAKPSLLPPLNGDASTQTYLEAVWVVAIFVVLLAILYPTAWKNVLAGLKAREKRIRQDIADAEAARLKAEAALREYTKQISDAEGKVREIMAKAAADAERLGQSIRMQAQTESEEIKERATQEIEAAKNQALREIYEQTAELATSVAEKILRRNLNVDDQRDLVTQSLEQMQEVGKN